MCASAALALRSLYSAGPAMSQPHVSRPAFSLLRQPAWIRLAGAAALAAAVWLLVLWAMAPAGSPA
ncbi:hypothetical protein CEG14_24675 [Bordetella genomosp. 1]|uniref:Uncharacterized protein n=1 Tax=Bordetella genomosp. 1 TaxID=1395607 RepID=A0A261RUZ8_9BORD|nr:hypothetical protein CEG14_24675 [Bordetella genomosp. 1]